MMLQSQCLISNTKSYEEAEIDRKVMFRHYYQAEKKMEEAESKDPAIMHLLEQNRLMIRASILFEEERFEDQKKMVEAAKW
jgi:hypothetical protein